MRIDFKDDLNKLFFTSDTHFFHKQVLVHNNRPFKDLEDHDNGMIDNWNSVVPEDGNIFMAGDFAFTGDIGKIRDLIDRLNGKIWWIMGNHDFSNKLDRSIIAQMVDGRQMDTATVLLKEDNNQRLFISHYPHMAWPRDCFHLFGHLHGGPNSSATEKIPFHPLRYEIGVDNNSYKPISYQQVKDIINKQKEL
jgi:calcineurin-like phosphoesterase family protein